MANKNKNKEDDRDYDTLQQEIDRIKVHHLANAVYHQSRRYHDWKNQMQKETLEELLKGKEVNYETQEDFRDFKRRMTKKAEEHARDLDLEAINNSKIVEQLRMVKNKILDQKELHQLMLKKRDDYATELKATVAELNLIYLNIINWITDQLQNKLQSDWTAYESEQNNPMAYFVKAVPSDRRTREFLPIMTKVLSIHFQTSEPTCFDFPILEPDFDLENPFPQTITKIISDGLEGF